MVSYIRDYAEMCRRRSPLQRVGHEKVSADFPDRKRLDKGEQLLILSVQLTSLNSSLTNRWMSDVFPDLAGPTTTSLMSRSTVVLDVDVDVVDLSSELSFPSRLPPIFLQVNDRKWIQN